MAGSGSSQRGCSSCCFSFLLTSGLTALFLWLSLRTSNPICSIQDFYVPALNRGANSTTNHTIYFDLKLDNGNKEKGIYYDAVNLTFYYGPDRSLPIGNYTVPGFYQGHKKKARRKELVETHGVPWEEASRAVSNGSTVDFRVDLDTKVRFKIMAWKTKRNRLVVGTTVQVNNEGKKVSKKGIRLKSGATILKFYRAPLRLLVVFSVLLLLVFN